MLTLGWAVDQSRRAFRAKSRGSRVHPDGRRTASSSRGGDGTPGTPTRGAPREMDDAGARSPKSPRRVPPARGRNLFGRGDSADGLRAGRYQGHRRGGARAKPLGAGNSAAFRVWRPHPSTARRRRGLRARLVLAPRVRVQAAPPHAPDGRERRRRVPERGRASASVAFGVDAVRAGAGEPPSRAVCGTTRPGVGGRRFRARRRARVFRRTRGRAGSGTTAGTVYGRHTRHAGSSSRRRPRTETSRRLGGDESRGWERRAG